MKKWGGQLDICPTQSKNWGGRVPSIPPQDRRPCTWWWIIAFLGPDGQKIILVASKFAVVSFLYALDAVSKK